MKSDISSLEVSPGRRAAEYWFVDGLPELVFGLALLLVGGVPLALLQLHSASLKPVMIPLYLGFLALFIWDRRVLGWLKALITYPRTGYVRPPGNPVVVPDDAMTRLSDPNPPRIEENVTWFRNRTVMVFFIGGNVVSMFRGAWSLAIVMVAVAAALFALNRNLEHPYSLRSVMPLAFTGLPFHWIQVPPKGEQCVPFLIGGVWLLLRGSWTLFRYLRDNPSPHGAEEFSSGRGISQ